MAATAGLDLAHALLGLLAVVAVMLAAGLGALLLAATPLTDWTQPSTKPSTRPWTRLWSGLWNRPGRMRFRARGSGGR